jgi:hypothetical protein
MTFGSVNKIPPRVPISSGVHGPGPRQPSLLQRGQSFTHQDLEDKNFYVKPNADMDSDDQASVSVLSEGTTGASPVSVITNSPPSSANSSHSLHEAEMEVEVEPYTPVNQTFPSNIHSSAVTPTGRRVNDTANSTPKVTVTTEAPWTAKSDAGRRSDEEDEIDTQSDRFTKRQKTRTDRVPSNGSSN